jgi:hypothetical protein
MLVLMAAIFFWMYLQCVCVCVCVSRGFWWQDSEKSALTGGLLVPLLVLYLLNSKNRNWDYLRCYCWQDNDDSVNKYIYMCVCMNKYIYIYTHINDINIYTYKFISCFQHNLFRIGHVCLLHDLWYEAKKNMEQVT